jgi:excisionase family DNA binding protein
MSARDTARVMQYRHTALGEVRAARTSGRDGPITTASAVSHRRAAGLPPLLTVSQAARLLGTSRSTLYAAIRSGDSSVPVLRIGRQWRVPLAAVERILEGIMSTGPDSTRRDARQTAAGALAGACASCGAASESSSRPTWSDALRSSSSTTSV